MKRLELTDQEMQTLLDLLDAGVRYAGLKCVAGAATLYNKVLAAEEIEVKEKPIKKAEADEIRPPLKTIKKKNS